MRVIILISSDWIQVAGYDESFVTLHIGKHSSFGLVQAAGRTWQLGTSPKMPHAHRSIDRNYYL